jgi:hypothetical protein
MTAARGKDVGVFLARGAEQLQSRRQNDHPHFPRTPVVPRELQQSPCTKCDWIESVMIVWQRFLEDVRKGQWLTRDPTGVQILTGSELFCAPLEGLEHARPHVTRGEHQLQDSRRRGTT